MRQFKRPKLDAIQHPETRAVLAGLADHLQEVTAALSRSVQTGPAPVANPTPTPSVVPVGGGTTLPSPTQGTMLRGTAAGAWENLALGADGQFLKVANQTFSWATLTMTNKLLDGSSHTDTENNTCVRGDLIVGDSSAKWARLGIGANTYVLTSNGTDAAWAAPPSSLPSVTRGDILVGNSSPAWASLAIGASGRVLTTNGTDPSWVALDNTWLSNRTRYLYLDAADLYDSQLGSPGADLAGTPPSTAAYISCSGANDTWMLGNLIVPADFVSWGSATVYYSLETVTAAKTVVWDARMLQPVIGTTLWSSATHTHSNTNQQLITGFTGLALQSLSISLSGFTGYNAGDLIRFVIGRPASSNGSDDASGNVARFFGVRLSYTADM